MQMSKEEKITLQQNYFAYKLLFIIKIEYDK